MVEREHPRPQRHGTVAMAEPGSVYEASYRPRSAVERDKREGRQVGKRQVKKRVMTLLSRSPVLSQRH